MTPTIGERAEPHPDSGREQHHEDEADDQPDDAGALAAPRSASGDAGTLLSSLAVGLLLLRSFTGCPAGRMGHVGILSFGIRTPAESASAVGPLGSI